MFKISLKFVVEDFMSIEDFLQNFYQCEMGGPPPISTSGIEILNIQMNNRKLMVNIVYSIDDGEELDFSNLVIDRINERYDVKTDIEFV
jgi:hypothetical protein